jgi:hypothetical protein
MPTDRFARDSGDQMRHRAHHPNKPRHRRKRQRLPSQPNHHFRLLIYVTKIIVLVLFPRVNAENQQWLQAIAIILAYFSRRSGAPALNGAGRATSFQENQQ